MQYEGKLYGKVPAGYIPLMETTKDVDAMRERIKALEEVTEIYKKADNSNPLPTSILTYHQKKRIEELLNQK